MHIGEVGNEEDMNQPLSILSVYNNVTTACNEDIKSQQMHQKESCHCNATVFVFTVVQGKKLYG